MDAEILNLESLKNKELFTKIDGFVKFPPNSVFFHLNENILYENSKQNEIYKEKSILLIGSGSIKRISVLKSLRLLSFKHFVCLTKIKESWTENFFDDWIIADHEDINNKENTLNSVKNYMSNNNITFDAILTYDDFCVLITSYLISELNYKGIPFDFAEIIKNKYEFRSLCSKLNINHPNFFLIKSSERTNIIDSLKIDFNGCNFPLIVKNTYGVSKDFVKKCNTIEEFKNSIKESLDKPMDLLIEEYFEGFELDIDVLIQNNEIKFLCISDNFDPKPPNFYELGGITPSIKLNRNQLKIVEKLIIKWLSMMNFQNSILHFEARFNPKLEENLSLMPIEINPRLGGCETWSNLKASSNIDFIRENLNICLGIEVNLNKDVCKFRSISKNFLVTNYSLEEVRLNIEKLANDDVIEFVIFKPINKIFKSNENIGWISIRNKNDLNEEQLISKLDENLKNLILINKKI